MRRLIGIMYSDNRKKIKKATFIRKKISGKDYHISTLTAFNH